MTIKELIDRLSAYPEEMRVFIDDDISVSEITTNTQFVKSKPIHGGFADILEETLGVAIGEEILEIRIHDYE